MKTISHLGRSLGLLLCGLLALPATVAADVVTDWNAILRDAIQQEGDGVGHANPGWSTRAMAMMNGAIYDCFQAVDHSHKPFHAHPVASPGASKVAAAIQAARAVASTLYASQAALFEAQAADNLATIPDGPEKTDGIALGIAVAQAYLAWRADDGAEGLEPYSVTDAPGRWEPDPLHPDQQAWGPAWRSVATFCMADSGQFQPPAPPALDSAQYTASFEEVKALGKKVSTVRTDEQTEIGLFWAYDRAHIGPPPVMYNRCLSAIAGQMGTTMEQNARLFAMASVAMADAAIAAWDCKFIDDFWRPITGIREADADGNLLTTGDPDWEPLGAPGPDSDDFTPPFPAYVSGHATMGEALFRVLATSFGSDAATFTLTSEELPGVERVFTSFSQASDENATSRVYLGIHWDFDSIEGQVLGRNVADYVAANYFLPLPPPLSISLAQREVTLEWEGAGILQVSSSLQPDSWEDLPEAMSPLAMTVAEARARYFRVLR